MKPMRQAYQKHILLSVSSYLHKYIITINMKTDPSYTFQHSLLTREVFIQVHGHFQTEESHKKNRIGNHICIASYQPALS